MTLNRTHLQSLAQKTDESFKEYVHHWRKLAARVQPSLLEKELVDMFMGTLQGPHMEKLIGSTSARFSDLVVAGERIKNYLKSGNIQSIAGPSNETKKPYADFAKKKEGETNNASVAKGKLKAYQAPYQQVAVVAPNSYQQPPYTIHVEHNVSQ